MRVAGPWRGAAPAAPGGGPARAGVALVAAPEAVVSIAALGAYLMQAQATTARRQSLSSDTRTALYTAEAGFAGPLASFDASLAERILAVRWQKPDVTYTPCIQPAGSSSDDMIARWRTQQRQARAVTAPSAPLGS